MVGRFARDLARLGIICAALQGCARTPPPIIAKVEPPPPAIVAPPPIARPVLDRLGRTEIGKASYYAAKFRGRRMADGRRYMPEGAAAASKLLPLGSTAKVINLDTGKSAIVQVQDRGPYVAGRVIDVSLRVAERLHMTHAGVVHVAVKPVAVPRPDGSITLGTGAAETPPRALEAAVRTTERLAADLN